ncbi:MAG: hypothetical protein GBAus27B_000126 [Mycoplasmataceae bacterium]|nr:MAG: hypothetical protein GBAus27B_000126 [Mycoplasmataceae bacterium]
MSPTKKLNFNFLKNGLRIIFLFVFLHWIFWFTTYAKGTNYFEAIKDEKIDKHDAKTNRYNNKGLLGDERKEKNIVEIEEDVLAQIEQKKGLNKNDNVRLWKNKELPHLESLDERIKNLEKKQNLSQAEKKELETKKKDYEQKLKIAKDETIKNIQNQLKENNLNITELDDARNQWQRITYDPLKFFLISPLNKISKTLELSIILEIIFKLLVVEILLIFLCYPETIIVWESMDKMKDDSLSLEEKERLNEESSPWIKYWFFNGFMTLLFSTCVFIHPVFFDRTSSWFNSEIGGFIWCLWIIPLFISNLLSNASIEFLRRGNLPNKQELKSYLMKNLVISFGFALFNLALVKTLWMNSKGGYFFFTLSGLTKFAISIIRVKIFGHREHSPSSDTKTIV